MTPISAKFVIRAKTQAELKQKVRAAMGWPDRRTWTKDEWSTAQATFAFDVDHRDGWFYARPRSDFSE